MRSGTSVPLLPLLLLGVLLFCGIASAQIAGCKSTQTIEEYYACYDTQNPCGKDCDDGYYEVNRWRCGVCFCETCCYKRNYPICNECNSGLTLSSDKRSCIDINECNQLPPRCRDGTTCTNTFGSFTCSACPSGTTGTGQTGCTVCQAGKWGVNCANTCACGTGVCNPVDGSCDCTGTGFSGPSCSTPICGDSRVVGSEQCDDGNTNNGDCCSSTCRFEASGTICTSDNNPCTNDRCNAQGVCTHIRDQNLCFCGNAIVDPGEQCDTGPSPQLNCPYGATSCQVCSNCTYAPGATSYCGDGVIASGPGEKCDDGNTNSNDGCSQTCQLEIGWICATPNTPCTVCPQGTFGLNCSSTCGCQNGASCDPRNGACTCASPWVGSTCTILLSPRPTDVTSSPLILYARADSLVELQGAFASSLTRIGFVGLGMSCASAKLGVTVYSAPNVTVTGGLPAFGRYHLCLSYDEGSTFIKQDNVEVYALAPPATSSSITAFSPSELRINTDATLIVSGQVPSNTTRLAFSQTQDCANPVGVTPLPPGSGASVALGAKILTDGDYFLCYSTNNGATYVRQTVVASVKLLIQDAAYTSVGYVSPGSITVGTMPAVTLYGELNSELPKAASVYFSLVPSSQLNCNNVLAETQYLGAATLAAPVSLTGDYSICYSTDSKSTWYIQLKNNVRISVVPPVATPTSIASITPSQIEARATPLLTFQGAVPSSTTYIAFVPSEASSCAPGDRVVLTRLGSTVGSAAQVLSEPFVFTGTYRLCYSTDGSTFELQSNPNTVLTVVAPAATNTSILSITPDTATTVQTPNVTFTGAVPSATTKVRFVLRGAGGSVSCASSAGEYSLEQSTTASVAALSQTGSYAICYSVGSSWVPQVEVEYTVVAPAATSTSITSLTPSQLTVGSTQSVMFAGAVPSAKSLIGFTLSASACTDLQAVSNINTSSSTPLLTPLQSAGAFHVCYSTTAGQTWVLQTEVLATALPPAASATSITSISPSLLITGQVANFSFGGAVPSSQTSFAFVDGSPSGCASASGLLSVTSLTGPTALLSSPFSKAKTYSLCYSTNGGVSFVGQTTSGVVLVVRPPDATPTSIQSVDAGAGQANQFYARTSSLSIHATGAVPSSRSIIRFTRDFNCENGADVAYTQEGAALNATLLGAGEHFLCYSTDNRGTWVRQNLRVLAVPPPATAASVTSLTPSMPFVLASNEMTFTGAIPSNQTRVAFVLGTNCSQPASSYLLSSNTQVFASSFAATGSHSLCYSTDNGSTWVRQTSVSLSAIPPPAQSTDITKILNAGVSGGTYATLSAKTPSLSVAITGGVPSPQSRIGFVTLASGVCNSASMVAVTPYTSHELTLSGSFTFSGLHFSCYSTDNGLTYVRQRSGFVLVIPPPLTPTTVTSLSPSNVTALASFELSAVGLVFSGQTVLAFVPENKECTSPSSPGDTSAPIQVTFSYGSDHVSAPAFLTTGVFALCVSSNLGVSFTKQTLPGSRMRVLAPAATTTSIDIVSPPIIYLGLVETTSLLLVGGVGSEDTYIALSSDGCTSSFLRVTRARAFPVNLTRAEGEEELVEGAYQICYATRLRNGSPHWFHQTQVSIAVGTITENSSEEKKNRQAYLIGGIVGGVCGLLAILAVVFGVISYKRSRKLKRFETIEAMAPITTPSFLPENPIFEQSTMYQPDT